MLRHLVSGIAVVFSGTGYAACADYLDHPMRKLHSKEQVNLCDVQDGKPMLIVNTASHCGYTSQFKGLEQLQQQYAQDGLVIVGFASDDFNQGARDEASAAKVCYVNYGVTFTMMAPSHVKGINSNPVFEGLAQQSQPPRWNFNKYLVDRSGQVVQHFGSDTAPDSKVLRAAIESVL